MFVECSASAISSFFHRIVSVTLLLFGVALLGNMQDACSSYIREIAVQPDNASNIAIGGFDAKLIFIDLIRPDNPYVQRLHMLSSIGSVKWAPFHGGQHQPAALLCSHSATIT